MTVYNDVLSKYIQDLFVNKDGYFAEGAIEAAIQNSNRQGLPAISIKPEEGRFLQFLLRAIGAQKAVEIGTLGGHSGIWIASGLTDGGRLITLEKEPRHARVARENFVRAGVSERVEIRLGDAVQLLEVLTPEGPFDFVFIDADKDGYNSYLDWALENVRVGGVIAAHNAFRRGSVAGAAPADEYTATMQAFNRRVSDEPRLLSTVFPAGDGMLMMVKVF